MAPDDGSLAAHQASTIAELNRESSEDRTAFGQREAEREQRREALERARAQQQQREEVDRLKSESTTLEAEVKKQAAEITKALAILQKSVPAILKAQKAQARANNRLDQLAAAGADIGSRRRAPAFGGLSAPVVAYLKAGLALHTNSPESVK